MAVIEKVRRGKRILVLEIRYRQADGTIARLRRDSKAPTKTAAREEEKRILDRIARTGSPYEPTAEPKAELETALEAPGAPTFGEVAKRYRCSFMLTDLKVTTRRGYGSVLDNVLVPRFGALPITAIDGEAACQLDLELSQKEKAAPKKKPKDPKGPKDPKAQKAQKKRGEQKAKLTRATRNNLQIVLRSVLRFAKDKGLLDTTPTGLPRLKKVEQRILEIPTDDEVQVILAEATEHQCRAFALIAYAGLRPNEVRALCRETLPRSRKIFD